MKVRRLRTRVGDYGTCSPHGCYTVQACGVGFFWFEEFLVQSAKSVIEVLVQRVLVFWFKGVLATTDPHLLGPPAPV